MKSMEVKLMGIVPLILHSDRGVNPLDPLVREMKKITGAKTKTDEMRVQIARLEYTLALPVNSKGHPALPTYQIAASIRDGAKKSKRGKDTRSGIFINADDGFIPLIYEGTKDVTKLFETAKFVDARTVVVQRARIIRTRPIFPTWSLEFKLEYDDDVFDTEAVADMIRVAGQYCGLGDYRPEYGRYLVETK